MVYNIQEDESNFSELAQVMKIFSPITTEPNFMESKSIPERLLFLKGLKENIFKKIEGLQNIIQNLDTKIDLLQNTTENES